jgi:hypothetical protein
MRQFMIHYRRANGSDADWHSEIDAFVAALDADPALSGKISYRVVKRHDEPEYFHIATVHDEAAVKILQSRPFFTAYSGRNREVSGGNVEVVPLDFVAETNPAA